MDTQHQLRELVRHYDRLADEYRWRCDSCHADVEVLQRLRDDMWDLHREIRSVRNESQKPAKTAQACTAGPSSSEVLVDRGNGYGED